MIRGASIVNIKLHNYHPRSANCALLVFFGFSTVEEAGLVDDVDDDGLETVELLDRRVDVEEVDEPLLLLDLFFGICFFVFS